MKLSLATIGSLLAAYAAAAPVAADDATNQALKSLAENVGRLNNEDHGNLNGAGEEVKKTVHGILATKPTPEKRDGYIKTDKGGVANVAALNNDFNHNNDKRGLGGHGGGGDTYVKDDKGGLINLSLLDNDFNHNFNAGKRGHDDGGDTYVKGDKAGVANVAALNNDFNHNNDVDKRDESTTQGLEKLLQGVLDEVKGLPETVESLQLEQLIQSLLDEVKDLPQTVEGLLSAVEKLVSGLLDQIEGLLGELPGQVGDILDTLTKSVESLR